MSDNYEKRKAEALARGDAMDRLNKLTSTDTSRMNQEQLQKHRDLINEAMADLAAGG
ncbi:hypothetical protein FY140_13715 [Agrobacterium tumefaciens]|uniref:hypothetical protein n=1 Tax=Agrobacterium tumefaciens TaxID=358 RepID=UPI0021D000C9|nr:hypothetical protein [Agrobacterium tumefaciens]UXT21815.1 hypothetical protein FY140_13715 [Agrobacterium tumefaciens]